MDSVVIWWTRGELKSRPTILITARYAKPNETALHRPALNTPYFGTGDDEMMTAPSLPAGNFQPWIRAVRA